MSKPGLVFREALDADVTLVTGKKKASAICGSFMNTFIVTVIFLFLFFYCCYIDLKSWSTWTLRSIFVHASMQFISH